MGVKGFSLVFFLIVVFGGNIDTGGRAVLKYLPLEARRGFQVGANLEKRRVFSHTDTKTAPRALIWMLETSTTRR
jgi:hypothetical protein